MLTLRSVASFSILFTSSLLIPSPAVGQNKGITHDPLRHQMSTWVDSVFTTLSVDQKIGQLFMTRMYSNRTKEYEAEITRIIRACHVGGLVTAQGGPVRQVRLLNYYQEVSNVPLMVASDAEWGLGMRLDSTISYPYQMTLGAINDRQLIYEMGRQIASQLRATGVHINFAPVVDINSNPDNPVIGFRSFGEKKDGVTQRGRAYMKGLQDNGILAVAKHFPGHGDTDTDSHKALPLITKSREHLDDVELYPFRQLIRAGLEGIMIGHLNVPALDATEDLPSSLSEPIVTQLLREGLDFDGLIFTDAMTMKGITGQYSVGDAAVKAILAGNDVILVPENLPAVVETVKEAIRRKQIPLALIDRKCRKILAFKYSADLAVLKKTETRDLTSSLNSPQARLLNRKLFEASVTVLRNKGDILPLKRLDTLRIMSLSIGRDSITSFQQTLSHYTRVDHFNLPKNATQSQIDAIRKNMKGYNLILMGIHEVFKIARQDHGYDQEITAFMNELAQMERVIVTSFRNPYTLDHLTDIYQSHALITTYQNNRISEEIAAQLIFGAIGATGKLPVTVNDHFKAGDGEVTQGHLRLKYTLSEEVGIDSRLLMPRLDSIITEAIAAKAFPGCQLLIAKDQKVIFYDTYGFHTYDSVRRVQKDDLYDFASVTKVTGPLPPLMKLHDEGKFDLDTPLKQYWPQFRWSKKANIKWRNVLAHNARLKAWIPYWRTTLRKNGKFKPNTLQPDSSEQYPLRITGKLYGHKNYRNKIYKAIKRSKLNENEGYLYSGLSFYLYPEIIENLTGESFEPYLKKNFFLPLGAYSLTYNPMRFYSKQGIIPTELDTFFRKEQIHGTVHDEGAIMMGGVSGNAGLFGNANDLAKLMQMYLNLGSYGGHEYITHSTFTKFTSCQYCEQGNRRGLGFDKPLLEDPEKGYVAPSASLRSFGHSGYTGTMVWADPEYDLLFIFLSNRVYPTRENRKLYNMNIRPRLHQAVYDLIQPNLNDH